MSSSTRSESHPERRPAFVTTHWSLILTASGTQTPAAQDALEELCRTYWYPLYVYVRRRGRSPEDAKDLTQDFFARLLERHSLANARPQRGKFRSFLLGAMNHCLADDSARKHAQKRGSGRLPESLDLASAEQRFELEATGESTPDQAFDQQWATALLNRVLDRLKCEYQQQGKGDLFAQLKLSLVGTRESQPYARLAEALRTNEGAVRTAVHRLRRRYRELIREEIVKTVSAPEEVEEEMRYLLRIAAG